MTDLRDLEADRRLVERFREIRLEQWTTSEKDILANIADAALDEIERLKGLLVFQVENQKGEILWSHVGDFCSKYPAEADAWLAVRKAACK